MASIDPDRIDLARAYLADPFADHGAEVAALCTALRMAPVAGKHVLVEAGAGAYELCRLGARRHATLEHLGVIYTSLADAERDVFRRRWMAATGRELPA